jgi:hypothetical protein
MSIQNYADEINSQVQHEFGVLGNRQWSRNELLSWFRIISVRGKLDFSYF